MQRPLRYLYVMKLMNKKVRLSQDKQGFFCNRDSFLRMFTNSPRYTSSTSHDYSYDTEIYEPIQIAMIDAESYLKLIRSQIR